MGYVWQRAILILGLICIPISALLLSAEHLLLAIGQTPAVAAMTATYIRSALGRARISESQTLVQALLLCVKRGDQH